MRGLSTWLKLSQAEQPGGDAGQYYERRGVQATRRIARAVAHKSWKWTLLNLAWTVGPVTFIGLQVGSLAGFGKTAANETFIYFAVYTAIAGLCAAVGSIFYDAFQKPKIQREQQRLLSVIDHLFSLMLATRNAILEELEPNERRIMSAYYILSGSGVNPSAVGTAVMDLTQNTELARLARRVDVFAEQGMDVRVRETWQDIEPRLEGIREELENVAPQAYTLLLEHLRGGAPRVQNGIERSDGFIERVLSAADEEDEARMTLHDAYEMLALAFELLNGRRIPMLDVRFEGDSAFERAQKAYDEARQQYRIALRRRNSRIRLLAERLYAETDFDAVADATDSISRLITMLREGLKHLTPGEQARYKRFYEEEIYRWHKLARNRYDYLLRVEKAYRRAWQRYSPKLNLSLQTRGLRRSGFVIVEEEIALADRQKLMLARGLDRLLSDVEIRTGRSLRVYDVSDEHVSHRFTAQDFKQMAMETANLLDDLIDLSQPEEQLAIESSNMANFGSLDIDISPQHKAGCAATLVDALHENRRKASHRLARSLTRFYRVTLSEEMIAYFVRHFGADEHYLAMLNQEAGDGDAPEQHLPAAPYPLPHWRMLAYDPYKLGAYYH